MDIIDLLVQDHEELRRELVEINHALSRSDLRSRIKLFISRYELHESIEEDILFPALDTLPEDIIIEKLMPNYEKTHERIWVLLDQLVESLKHVQFSELQQAFFKFCASVEAHLGHEERVLFPVIREIVDRLALESLGEAAEKRIAKYVEA